MTTTDSDNRSATTYFRQLHLVGDLLRRVRFAREHKRKPGEVEAGSAADCGHERVGGEFGKGNTCAKCDRQCKLAEWLNSHKHEQETDEWQERQSEWQELEDEKTMKPWRDEQEQEQAEEKAIQRAKINKDIKRKLKLQDKQQKKAREKARILAGEKKFKATMEMLPKSMRGRVPEDQLRYIKNKDQLDNAIELYEWSRKNFKYGELPTFKEMALLTHIGESVRGQYEWASRFLVRAMGPRDANIWAALNAVLSTQSEAREHTIAAFRMLAIWKQAGEPRDARSINKLISELGRMEITTAKGTITSLYKGLIVREGEKARKRGWKVGKRGWPGKWSGIRRILSRPDTPDFEKLITTAPTKLQKTPEFYRAWAIYKEWNENNSFAYDRHMGKATKPKLVIPGEIMKTGKKAYDFLTKMISKRSSRKKLTKEDSDALGIIKEAQGEMIENPGKYLAFKAVANEMARRETKRTGIQLDTKAVQEMAWSGIYAISLMKAYNYKPEEIAENLTHETVSQVWDIRELLQDKDVQNDLRQIGVSEGAIAAVSRWEEFSEEPEPPRHGKIPIDPGDEETLQGLARRLPPIGGAARSGRGIWVPDEKAEGGVRRAYRLRLWKAIQRFLKRRQVTRYDDPRSWVSCGGDETVHGPASTPPNFLSSEQVARIIAHQFHNRPKHFRVRDMENIWTSSTLYELRSIPTWLITPLAQVKPGRKSHSSGPIIVDLNKNELERHFGSFGHDMRICILDGKHRLREHINEHGDSEIDAFVGTESIPLVEEVVNEFGPRRQAFTDALDSFYSDPDDHRTWHELIEAGHGVGLSNSQLRRLWHEFARGQQFSSALGIFVGA